MIRKGDTVLVSIPTYLTGFNTYSSARSQLQANLQQAGFSVLRINDDALSYLGVLGTRGNLLVTVVPTTSDYANVQDVASLVAGTAYAVGYNINAGASGSVLATAGTDSDAYRALQQARGAAGGDNGNDPLAPFIDTTTAILIGGAILLLVLLKK